MACDRFYYHLTRIDCFRTSWVVLTKKNGASMGTSGFRKIVLGAAFAFLAVHGSALAGQQDFAILNKTGYAIKHIYVSETNNNSWDEDVLGRDVLEDGESFDLAFAKSEKTCKWDMKAVYDDGESVTWQGLDLCKISKLTLKWNKSTGVTTAVAD